VAYTNPVFAGGFFLGARRRVAKTMRMGGGPSHRAALTSRPQPVQFGGWPGLQTAEATTAADAPSFAYFAKGGYDDGIHNGSCRTDKSCAGSIAAHPFGKLRVGSCKKRKDGTPPVGIVQCKDGPPALYIGKCLPFNDGIISSPCLFSF